MPTMPSADVAPALDADPLAVPDGYRPLGIEALAAYLADTPAAAVLGGRPDAWEAREIGDGNLNLVSIVTGPSGGLAVKQALPYLRLVGEAWPLPLSRAHFEHLALLEHARHAPGRVPGVVHYDATMALIAMELLEPHIILRHGMMRGIRYPMFAEHIATFIARTAFFTADLALPAAGKKRLLEAFASNTALCKITEDLVFTEPYLGHANNRWTSPQLDKDAQSLREDGPLKVAVCELKERFLTSAQALVHGDLHTGSIMVTDTDTRVIDPEFAFVGPIGFDIGAVLGNLLMSYESQRGHATPDDPRDDYAEWVLAQVTAVWTRFADTFRHLWDTEHRGDAYPRALLGADASARLLAQDRYLRRLFEDSLGFAAAKMIRRIVGLAHNADFEQIADPDTRAACERRTLRLARHLMLERGRITDVGAVLDAARQA
jgi:5-methylthioribose kinase